MKQFLKNYINHSHHNIPDGIHYHESIKEDSIALGCQAPGSLLVLFLFIVNVMQPGLNLRTLTHRVVCLPLNY